MELLTKILLRKPRTQELDHNSDAAQGSPPTAGRMPAQAPPEAPTARPASADAVIERYRCMLGAASPTVMEQAHAGAFAYLTPAQRNEVRRVLTGGVPSHEWTQDDNSQNLSRMATKMEVGQPGTLEQRLGRPAPGVGGINRGTLPAGSLLASVAGGFVAHALATELAVKTNRDPTVMSRPATAFVADFVGLTNRLPAIIEGSHAYVLGVQIL